MKRGHLIDDHDEGGIRIAIAIQIVMTLSAVRARWVFHAVNGKFSCCGIINMPENRRQWEIWYCVLQMRAVKVGLPKSPRPIGGNRRGGLGLQLLAIKTSVRLAKSLLPGNRYPDDPDLI